MNRRERMAFWAREIGGLLLVVGMLWAIWRAMRQGGWG